MAALFAAAVLFIPSDCPQQGGALTPSMRAFALLKNRSALPQSSDFDQSVTLDALLMPGDDRARWAEERAGVIDGYVVAVDKGGVEAANCYSFTRRDIHIYVARSVDAPPRELLVVEVTPRWREWAARQGLDWSEATLKSKLVGRWCRLEGWLMFDREHADESENLAPGRKSNWRATAWELHPITNITVLR